MDKLVDEFCKTLKREVFREIDYLTADNMYERIVSYAGEPKMERLNALIETAFLPAQLMKSAAQHVISYAVGMLTYRDPESSKKVFQLALDERS